MAVVVEALPSGLMDSGSQQNIKGILKNGGASRQASFTSDDSTSSDSSPPSSRKHVRFADHLVSRIIFKSNSTPTQFRTKKRKNKKKNHGGARSRNDSQSDSDPEGAHARSQVTGDEEDQARGDGAVEDSRVGRFGGDSGGSRRDEQQKHSKSRRKRNNKRRRRRSGSESDTPREEDADFTGIAAKPLDGCGDGNGVASSISLTTSDRLKKKGKHTTDDGSESGSDDKFASSPSSMSDQSKMKGKCTALPKCFEE